MIRSPLMEDFSDAAAFVQEDTSYTEQNASEDEVERKIAEEHAKFKEAYAKRQEEVRASRPWSAPPVESPRPAQQKEREKERKARGSNNDVDLDAPRSEYEPPVRPYLLQAQTSGNNLSYLSRPQSAEHRTAVAARSISGHQPNRISLSGIEEEAGEGATWSSRQALEMARLGGTYGDGTSSYLGGAHDDDGAGRDQFVSLLQKVETLVEEDEGELPDPDGTIPEEEEGEDEEEAEEEDQWDGTAEGLGRADGEEQEAQKEEAEGEDGGNTTVVNPHFAEPSAEEIFEDEEDSTAVAKAGGEEVLADNYYGYGQQQQQLQPLAASHYGRRSNDMADEEREAAVREGEEQEQAQEGWRWQGSHNGEEALSTARGAPSLGASSTMSHVLAMRGFVEPLKYDGSFSGGSAGRRSPAAGRKTSGTCGGEEDDDDYAEDSFEEDEELEEHDHDGDGEAQDREQLEVVPSSERLLSPSGEGSLLRASPSASKALLGSSRRSRSGSAVLAPLSKESSRSISVASPLPPSASASTVSLQPPPQPPSGRQSVVDAEDDGPEAAAAVPLPPPVSLLSPSATAPPSLPPIFRVTGIGAADTAFVPEQLSGRSPLAASNSHRSISSNGSAIPASSALAPLPAPSPALSDLQPSQQFALQLLKHDIEVLPQHHRAAVEAAAARRKSSTARPPGASLAAFGYLGYHVVSEKLTAPSGPAFRSVSPGRGTSPGRGDGSLNGSPSLMGARTSGPIETATVAHSGGRPTSAPHMRPSSGAVGPETKAAKKDEGSSGGAAAAVAEVEEGGAAAPSGSGFVDVAREMRAGRLLPLVVVPSMTPREADDGPAALSENSVSAMGESAMNTAVSQSRMKFDVWLDALSGGGAAGVAAAGPSSNVSASGGETDRAAPHGAAAASGGHRPPRPMTAPASGRRRPISARPVGNAAGVYMQAPAIVAVPKPLVRPMSAQPHHVRPTSASMSRTGGVGIGGVGIGSFDANYELPVPMAFQPPDAASAAGGTAAVEVGGVTVSVYVADTLKRIVEANRWLQQLGLTTKRYRLKDRFSNMTIQMVEELPPLPSELAFGGANDGGAVAVIKELTLKQFLSGHSKLKQQARKLRNAAAAAGAQQQTPGGVAPVGTLVNGGVYGIPEFGSRRPSRPISASFASVGGVGGPAGLTTPRARPSSAMPYSGARTMSGSTGGVDPLLYGAGSLAGVGGGGAAAQAGFQTGRPVRPSSANPSYGRTSAFVPYNSGSSPPAVPSSPFMHSAYAAHAASSIAVPTATKSPGGGGATAAATAAGGFPQPRAAWGAAANSSPNPSGSPSYQGYPATSGRTSGGNGLPYMHRSITTTPQSPAAMGPDPDHTHIDDDNDSEQALVIEPDQQGDVSRALRQQLGSAADYCQARRQEIARLRTLPLA